MLKLVQSWLSPRANPIGVDFGSDCLRIAQVSMQDGEPHLIAAASADVPAHLRNNTAARILWFADAARDLLGQGRFKGRQCTLALPSAAIYIQHLRLPRTDDETLKKTLPFEARGKLPIDPSRCLLRHVVAGELFSEQDPKVEVIVMAAAKDLVTQLLDAAARAKLDVIGMNTEAMSLIDCFSHVYRRKSDHESTTCYIDIGSSGTRTMIARGQEILFARTISIGGDHFTRAVSTAMGIGFEEAKLLRIQSAAQPQGGLDDRRETRAIEPGPVQGADNSFALLQRSPTNHVAEPSAPVTAPQPARQLEQACIEPLNKLIDELNLCRRYHEATFPNKPVDRLLFVGGEARQRWMCQHVARQMQLAAQIGDPLVRMGRTTEVGAESGIDRRQPQPSWAVAVGLSVGPLSAAGIESPSSAAPERSERRGAA